MAFVTQQVQVDFVHDPASASFTWVDLTNRTRAAQYKRGRSYELASVEAATGTVKLRNDDGALDPGNGASTYAPNVLPYRRIQHNVTLSGSTTPIFTGLVERWPQEWDTGYGYAPVQVVDLLTFLAGRILAVGYSHEVAADAPLAFFPLDDASGSTSATNAVANGVPLAPAVSAAGGGDATFGGTPIPAAVSSSASSLSLNGTLTSAAGDDLKGEYLTGPTIPALGSTYTFEAWLKIDPNLLAAAARHTNGGAPIPIPGMCVTDSSGNVTGGLALFDLNDGKFRLAFLTATNSTQIYSAQYGAVVDLNDGRAHHVVITNSVTNGGIFYVDGASSTFGANLGSIAAGTVHVGGYLPFNWLYGLAPNYRGGIQFAAIYATELSSARVTAHYNIGANGFAGDTPGVRIGRILGYAGWTATTSLDAGVTPMGSISNVDGQSALAAIQAVEQSDQGLFYASKAGVLTYKSRRTLMANTTVAATFGENTAGGEVPYLSASFDFDPTYVYNDVQITREGGATAYAKDATSQSRYGVRTLTQTVGFRFDTDTADAAAWLLASYAAPHVRISDITIDAAATPGAWAALLPLEVGSRVVVKRRPFGAPVITLTCIVNSIAWDVVDTRRAACTLGLSPIPVQALILNDATYGVIDSTNRLGY